MSQFAAPASLRRISAFPPPPRDGRTISEIPPPIALAPPQVCKRIEFATLPRLVQERFLSAIDGSFPPSPILRSVRTAPSRAPYAFAASALGAAAIAAVLLRRGFGAQGDAMAIQTPAMTLVYCAVVAVAVFATMRAIATLLEARVLPWPPGIYVFPTTLVDARRPTLEVLPLGDLVSIEPHATSIDLVFEGGRRFPFAVSDGRMDETRASIESALETAKRLAADPDAASHYVLVDPLYDLPEAGPLASEDRLVLRVPGWARHAWIAALLAGAIAGPVLTRVRNRASDARLFARAEAEGTAEAYRTYLAEGAPDDARREEIQRVLLPQAEHREHRAKTMAELDRAIAKGTLAALREFAALHPDHGVPAELAHAEHAVYAAALERFRPHATDAEAFAFVERLLAFAEAHGGSVRVRFERAASPSLRGADHAVTGVSTFAGCVSLPSRYFDDAHLSSAEAVLVDAVRDRFAAILPAELVAIESPLDDGDATTVPALVVTHHVEWAGDTVTSHAPPGVFVALSFDFEARFVLPDGGPSLTLDRSIGGELPSLESMKRDSDGPSPEEAAYDGMTSDAFERFVTDLFARIAH